MIRIWPTTAILIYVSWLCARSQPASADAPVAGARSHPAVGQRLDSGKILFQKVKNEVHWPCRTMNNFPTEFISSVKYFKMMESSELILKMLFRNGGVPVHA